VNVWVEAGGTKASIGAEVSLVEANLATIADCTNAIGANTIGFTGAICNSLADSVSEAYAVVDLAHCAGSWADSAVSSCGCESAVIMVLMDVVLETSSELSKSCITSISVKCSRSIS